MYIKCVRLLVLLHTTYSLYKFHQNRLSHQYSYSCWSFNLGCYPHSFNFSDCTIFVPDIVQSKSLRKLCFLYKSSSWVESDGNPEGRIIRPTIPVSKFAPGFHANQVNLSYSLRLEIQPVLTYIKTLPIYMLAVTSLYIAYTSSLIGTSQSYNAPALSGSIFHW